VVLRGVDVVDAELDRAPQHRQRGVAVTRWAEHAGPRELHRAEADARHRPPRDRGAHGSIPRYCAERSHSPAASCSSLAWPFVGPFFFMRWKYTPLTDSGSSIVAR